MTAFNLFTCLISYFLVSLNIKFIGLQYICNTSNISFMFFDISISIISYTVMPSQEQLVLIVLALVWRACYFPGLGPRIQFEQDC